MIDGWHCPSKAHKDQHCGAHVGPSIEFFFFSKQKKPHDDIDDDTETLRGQMVFPSGTTQYEESTLNLFRYSTLEGSQNIFKKSICSSIRRDFAWFRRQTNTRNRRPDSVRKHGRGVPRHGLLGAACTPRRPNDDKTCVQHPRPKNPCILGSGAPGPTACTSGSGGVCAWRKRTLSDTVSNCDKRSAECHNACLLQNDKDFRGTGGVVWLTFPASSRHAPSLAALG